MNEPRIDNHFLVRSEHINANGDLFGGQLMAEIDTVAYCLLRTIYADCSFVTRAASIQFVAPAPLGAVVRFRATRERVGRTSVTVAVNGYVGDKPIAHAMATFVHVCHGQATPVPPEGSAPTACPLPAPDGGAPA